MQRFYLDNADAFGFRDYTDFLFDTDQFLKQRKNEPTTFEFTLIPVGNIDTWVRPQSGAYIRFEDDRWLSRHPGVPDSVVFTGYVTDPPKPVMLGMSGAQRVWGYQCRSTSEDFLINSKAVPAKTYVNKTRGYILTDLLQEMFKDSLDLFDLLNIHPGGTERVYQVDPAKLWTDIAADFASVDGFLYTVLDRHVYYMPEAAFLGVGNDASKTLVIDEADPRFNPDRVSIGLVSAAIVNDVTVFGEAEPTTVVNERFVSDGYSGDFRLAYPPYGTTEALLINDEFSSAIDSGTWHEEDDVNDYIQAFEGSLNVVGGPGADTGTVYLRSKKGVELAGIVDFRDGEISFPADLEHYGQGILGGLYTSDVPREALLWCGWLLQLNGPTNSGTVASIVPWGPDGAEEDARLGLNLAHSYILRKKVSVQRRAMIAPRRGPYGTTVSFGDDSLPDAPATITWTLEEINADIPENVVKTTRIVLSRTYASASPDYVLYAPVVPYDYHLVLNSVQVRRPQQVTVALNGAPIVVGDHLDGGRCTIVDESDSQSKLSWYSVPGSYQDNYATYRDTIMGSGASRYLRLGDPVAKDEVPLWFPPVMHGLYESVTGAIAEDYDKNKGVSIADNESYLDLGLVYFQNAGTIEVWVKTNDTRNTIPILGTNRFGNLGDPDGYYFGLDGGVMWAWNMSEAPGYTKVGSRNVADGFWHQLVLTWDTANGGSTKFYVDGALDVARSGSVFWALTKYSMLFHDEASDRSIVGSFDEFAVYPTALLAEDVLHHYVCGIRSVPEIVTIPPMGTEVSVSYRRRDTSKARIQDTNSIASERQKFRDDGVRQRVLQVGDVKPAARTSQECVTVGQAYLSDRTTPRYEGSYTFETQENGETQLDYWPMPGDRIYWHALTPDNVRMEEWLGVTNVSSRFLGKGVYEFSLDFGPVNRFESAQRQLMWTRKSSLDELSINDVEIKTVDTIDTINQPEDPTEASVVSVTATAVSVAMTTSGLLPSGVIGYEVRSVDTGWGQINYISRKHSPSFTLDRTKRDQSWFVRPYSWGQVPPPESFGPIYSDRSALIRVVQPLTNAMTLKNISGTMDTNNIELVVPLLRSPDCAGVKVVRTSDGYVYYDGDGIAPKAIDPDVTVIIANHKMTFEIPNPNHLTEMAFTCSVFDLTNQYGPETSFVAAIP